MATLKPFAIYIYDDEKKKYIFLEQAHGFTEKEVIADIRKEYHLGSEYKLKTLSHTATTRLKTFPKEINPSISQLTKCRKVLAEQERDTHKPTISHYRDMKNGIVSKRADAETELVIKQGNKREYYFLDSYGKAAVLEAARHLKNVKKWSGTVYCEAYSTSGLGGATNSKVNLSDMSYKHISQRDFEQQNGTTATAKNPSSELLNLLYKVQEAKQTQNSAVYMPYLSTKEKNLIKNHSSFFRVTDGGKSVYLSAKGVNALMKQNGTAKTYVSGVTTGLDNRIRVIQYFLEKNKKPVTAEMRKVADNYLAKKATLADVERVWKTKNPTTATVKRASNPSEKLTVKKGFYIVEKPIYSNVQRKALKTKYDKGSGAYKMVMKKVKTGVFYSVFDSPERDYLVFETKNKDVLTNWINNNSKNGTTATVKRASNPNTKEFVIWGVPPNDTYEQVLHTKAKTLQEAKAIAKVLEQKHNCKRTRIQVLDLTDGFNKDFTRTIRKNPKTTRKPNHSNTDFNSFVQATTRKNSRMFQGKLSGEQTQLTAPNGTPKNLSRLGELKLMIVKMPNGEKANITFNNDAFLVMDIRKNLHCVGKGAKINGVKVIGNGLAELGRLIQIDYVTDKKHINGNQLTHFYHKLGEVTGETPRLFIDKEKFPIIHGGNYDVWNVGIVN